MTGSAADLMLRNPKTLRGDASVAEVRSMLANPKVQMILLADGRTFRGAITKLPDDAAPTDRALDYADSEPETIPPDVSADEAFERASASPHRRVIVLDGDDNLLGLLCLNAARTGFCRDLRLEERAAVSGSANPPGVGPEPSTAGSA